MKNDGVKMKVLFELIIQLKSLVDKMRLIENLIIEFKIRQIELSIERQYMLKGREDGVKNYGVKMKVLNELKLWLI